MWCHGVIVAAPAAKLSKNITLAGRFARWEKCAYHFLLIDRYDQSQGAKKWSRTYMHYVAIARTLSPV